MNDLTIMIIRLVLATFLAGIIGLEREIRDQPAGLRTHVIVGMASCLCMLLSIYGFEPYVKDNVRIDISRIPSYVVSGIGFLGAGSILVNGTNIKGLTTAAGVWTVAVIGLVVGAGMYEIAVIATLIVVISLSLLKKIDRAMEKKRGD